MKGRNISATKWQGRLRLYVLGLALGLAPAFAAQALSVNLDAKPLRVAPGGQPTLSWTSSGAKWCWAHGGWGGELRLNGSAQGVRQWAKRWYAVTCSDGKKQVTDGVTVNVADGAQGLSVNLAANPSQVVPGGVAKMSWSSTGAKWCYAHDGWGGSRSLNGTADSPRNWQDRTYGITCSDGQRQVTSRAKVTVAGGGGGNQQQLSVKLNATPDTVKKGQSTKLSWTATGAESCTASGGWSGGRGASGSWTSGSLSQTTSFKLTCKRGSQTALASVTVTVANAPVVKWQPPTQNVDGTPLKDLAGYKFYWGKSSRTYSGNARVSDPKQTQFNTSQLPAGRYFVAVTALDSQGNESAYSNEVRIDVP